MMSSWFGGKGKEREKTRSADTAPPSNASTAVAGNTASTDTSTDTKHLTEFERLLDRSHLNDPKFQEQHDRVEKWKDELLRTSPMIRFMIKHLGHAGCSIEHDRKQFPAFLITKCAEGDQPPRSMGGFAPPGPQMDITESGIVLCADAIRTKGQLEHVLSHEMLHWWDSCKFKVDFNNLRHLACTEVRASMLSGECAYGQEKTRLRTPFLGRGHFMDCVRRRATASVAMNPGCADQATAQRIVDEVFDSCTADTRPFDAIY